MQLGRRLHERDEGQAIVLGALMMMVLLFAVGLAVDAGQLFVAKRTQQEAADSAAFAGAVILYQGGTNAMAISAATADATRNGYTDGVSGASVTVNSPPTSGLYSGDIHHVEVIIIKQVQTSLVPAEAAFNPVRARGVAGAETFNNGYALIALDTSCVAGAISVAPNEDIHLSGGGILVNSCSPNATVGFQATQDLTITPPYGIDVVGGTGTSTFPPTIPVTTGIAPLPDPFAGYPMPKPSDIGCTWPCPSLVDQPTGYGGTAFQGVYTSNLSGVALCHGIYILKGGGLGGDISRDTNPLHFDPNTGLPCDGRSLIFNTMSNWPSSGGTCTTIGKNGNHPITLRPMLTGTWANFQLYQDPQCTVDVQIGGNQTLDASGTIYVPNAAIHENGNPATIDGGQIIAKRLDIQNGNINVIYDGSHTAMPILPRLSE